MAARGAAARARKTDWCFTVHAGHFGDYEDEKAVMDRISMTECKYLVFQQETGAAKEGGVERDHLQGYVMFTAAKTMTAAQAALGVSCHMEIRRADKISDAIKYCKKLDTRRAGCEFFEKGEEPMDQGVKRTLRAACDLAVAPDGGVKRVAREMPEEYVKYYRGLKELQQIADGDRLPTWRDVNVIVLVGDSGCGKSYFAEHYDNREDTYPMGDSDPVWVDGYMGERTIVIEEFAAAMPFRFLLRLLDGYRLNMPNKGGFVWGQHTTVILTSNDPPDRWYNGAENQWSFDTAHMSAGPLQRRINSIHVGTGTFEAGDVAWDVPLPVRAPDVPSPLPQADAAGAPDTDIRRVVSPTGSVPGTVVDVMDLTMLTPPTPALAFDDVDVDDLLGDLGF